MNEEQILDVLTRQLHPLRGAPGDYDPLLEAIGDARFVLLGEASHGTREFYHERAVITRRLIEEKGFCAVAVEADWPDAYRVNCWVRGQNNRSLGEAGADETGADEALSSFKDRFPGWMWRNREVLEFVQWLREHNDARPDDEKAGFYGIDLYSLRASIDAVVRFLEGVDPEAAHQARERYSCFDHVQEGQDYARALAYERGAQCRDEVVAQLADLRRQFADGASLDGSRDAAFFAEQNARLVKNAEAYYRSMFEADEHSWNLRDRHMSDTLEALDSHLSRETPAKIVVWAHNSHLGDARATEASQRGEWNVGQLTRQRYDDAAFLIGFSTFDGEVTAARSWDSPGDRRRVRPAIEGSFERLFHEVSWLAEESNFALVLRDEVADALAEPRLERAIGVIYRPETERWSHYFHAMLPQQFDAMLHFDRTNAVEPLEPEKRWHESEVHAATLETFPSGL